VPYTTTCCGDNDWSWLWVFFIVIVFVLIIGAAALACCYYPTYDTACTGYPITYCEYGHTYIVNKGKDGSIYRAVVIDGDNNTVTYDSPETENMQSTSYKSKKSMKTQ
jgi:hypothetical protein